MLCLNRMNLSKTLNSLVILLILCGHGVRGQDKFIGDMFSELEPTSLLSTTKIKSPEVTFIENQFFLIVNKDDLLKILKQDTIPPPVVSSVPP